MLAPAKSAHSRRGPASIVPTEGRVKESLDNLYSTRVPNGCLIIGGPGHTVGSRATLLDVIANCLLGQHRHPYRGGRVRGRLFAVHACRSRIAIMLTVNLPSDRRGSKKILLPQYAFRISMINVSAIHINSRS